MQQRFRRFIREYNRRSGATILLTSHYMADVEALCPRIILINAGQVLYDGSLQQLASRLVPYKLLRVTLSDEHSGNGGDALFPASVDVLEHEASSWTMRVRQTEVVQVTASILTGLPVVDVAIEDPSIESVIDSIYQGGALCI